MLRCACDLPAAHRRPAARLAASRISATVSRSSPTVRSVVSESSAPGQVDGVQRAVRSSAATARSASPIVTAPGAWASAAASRSVRENTASRSERCAIAQATASAAGDAGAGARMPIRARIRCRVLFGRRRL